MDRTSAARVATIARIDVARIIPLRHAVLRHDLAREAAHFAGDELLTTLHLAALDGAVVVGCASFVKSPFAEEPAFQLRGMATDARWRGMGIGSRLLSFAEVLLREEPIRLRWCNARTSALGFYLKQGWTVVSPEFDIPTAGPHVRMTRLVPA